MKQIIASLIIVVALIVGVILVTNNQKDDTSSNLSVEGNNISIVDGKQIIEIDVRGGYQPRKSVAKAGIPTVIRFNTNNTFDCSAALSLRSLNVYKVLPQTGTTDIDIGIQKKGIFRGSCSMGMYFFDIDFKD